MLIARRDDQHAGQDPGPRSYVVVVSAGIVSGHLSFPTFFNSVS